MAYGYLDIAATPSVKAAQVDNGSLEYWSGFEGSHPLIGSQPARLRSSAAATTLYGHRLENGLPYVQHRGGPTDF